MTDLRDKYSMMEVAVFDLDGTLVKGSTFTIFVEWLFRKMMRERPFVALQLAGIVLARKLRLVSHARSKRRIMLLAADVADESDFSRFAHMVAGKVIPEMKDMIEAQREKGRFLILATAAPEEYAATLARELGFDYVAATSGCGGGDGCIECRGEEKLRRVMEICRRNHGEVKMVATDHKDDLPLLNLPGIEAFLVDW